MYVRDYLVLPLELRPHAPELRLCARGGDDVVHDVYVDVVEDDDVPVPRRTLHVVHDVAEDDAVLRRGDLHVGLDVREVVWSEDNRLKISNIHNSSPMVSFNKVCIYLFTLS